ncbi:hypothetical protein KBA41_01645 [Candidatus Ozemobacteraceae bacterium]|nr:hypothetical protein [Candidatus Ozemobacteraceae bacterium]
MKKFLTLVLAVAAILCAWLPASAADIKVLYDDTHGQTAGNADWIVTGAYSEMCDMLKENGFIIDSLSKVSSSRRFTPDLLARYDAVILAEPNNPYEQAEQTAIVAFVKNGGGAFLIGDHGNADRDNDGWDAVKALNTFCGEFGFTFTGNYLYEAPVSGAMNKEHPAMFGVRGVGAWAASTFTLAPKDDANAVGLIDSRYKKAPYVVAAEAGKGRVIGLGDSSPFDDGTSTPVADPSTRRAGGVKKLHDSYDSFMYSHPQLAYNAMMWVTGRNPEKRIPSREVKFWNEAAASDRAINILIDAAHGNAASDKMETFERHMVKNGFKVYYTLNLITPEMVNRFAIVMLPNTSLPIMDPEMNAIVEWFMAGGRLVMSCDWDSSDLDGRNTLNNLLSKLGSVMRYNDDQVWDNTNKTNKPWGVLAHVLKSDSPVMAGVKTVITWGTCSLLTRDGKPLTAEAGVDVLITGDDDTINKDGDKKNDAVIYPKGTPIAIMAQEQLANGILTVIGCSNFTDYQYPDSDINASKPGPAPFTHETPAMYDNLMKQLSPAKAGATRGRSPARGHRR